MNSAISPDESTSPDDSTLPLGLELWPSEVRHYLEISEK